DRQLGVNRTEVFFDTLDGDRELFGDGGVGCAGGDQFGNFELARRQRVRGRTPSGALCRFVEQRGAPARSGTDLAIDRGSALRFTAELERFGLPQRKAQVAKTIACNERVHRALRGISASIRDDRVEQRKCGAKDPILRFGGKRGELRARFALQGGIVDTRGGQIQGEKRARAFVEIERSLHEGRGL